MSVCEKKHRKLTNLKAVLVCNSWMHRKTVTEKWKKIWLLNIYVYIFTEKSVLPLYQ